MTEHDNAAGQKPGGVGVFLVSVVVSRTKISNIDFYGVFLIFGLTFSK